jgi:hypothetical protein
MSWYRKVEIKLYGDEKFRKLSPITPCGQGLWLYLITGPHTTSLPGLFSAGRAALAEQLAWPQEDFDKAFEEVLRQGMAKADFQNRVIWIPKALRHNQPASPNVVKSWVKHLDSIPECELKREAMAAITTFLRTLSPGFLAAFLGPEETSRKASLKSDFKAIANQDQDQKHDQQQETVRNFELGSPEPRPGSDTFIALLLNDKTAHPISEQQVGRWEQLYPLIDIRQELRNYAGWSDANPGRRKTSRGILASLNYWLSKANDRSRGNGRNRDANGSQQRKDGNREAARRALERLDGPVG